MYKPMQFSLLAALMGGFHMTRIWHFLAMCGFLAFIPGHLLMVAIHGWSNFYSIFVGWKKNPEYVSARAGAKAFFKGQPSLRDWTHEAQLTRH